MPTSSSYITPPRFGVPCLGQVTPALSQHPGSKEDIGTWAGKSPFS